ncbi:hypothetical protein D9757_011814 [Collybiopsis confluens]|uniref:Uncharacterized protein n=1 Tax=Collybiopsis confluens TaxID=2823264 RepID=A0A8H5GGE5_9AGAR|nr:hypothetical protein D9757_011814 [Collybiopsis confluens]
MFGMKLFSTAALTLLFVAMGASAATCTSDDEAPLASSAVLVFPPTRADAELPSHLTPVMDQSAKRPH